MKLKKKFLVYERNLMIGLMLIIQKMHSITHALYLSLQLLK